MIAITCQRQQIRLQVAIVQRRRQCARDAFLPSRANAQGPLRVGGGASVASEFSPLPTSKTDAPSPGHVPPVRRTPGMIAPDGRSLSPPIPTSRCSSPAAADAAARTGVRPRRLTCRGRRPFLRTPTLRSLRLTTARSGLSGSVGSVARRCIATRLGLSFEMALCKVVAATILAFVLHRRAHLAHWSRLFSAGHHVADVQQAVSFSAYRMTAQRVFRHRPGASCRDALRRCSAITGCWLP